MFLCTHRVKRALGREAVTVLLVYGKHEISPLLAFVFSSPLHLLPYLYLFIYLAFWCCYDPAKIGIWSREHEEVDSTELQFLFPTLESTVGLVLQHSRSPLASPLSGFYYLQPGLLWDMYLLVLLGSSLGSQPSAGMGPVTEIWCPRLSVEYELANTLLQNQAHCSAFQLL